MKNPRGLTVTEVGKELDISRNSASKYLDVMLSADEVVERQIGRARLFHLSQRVPLSALLDYSSDLIVVVNREMEILQTNSRLNSYELDPDSVIGKNLVSDTLFGSKYNNEIKQLVDLINRGKKEFEIHVQDQVLLIRVLPTTFQDGSQGFTLICSDVSERYRYRDTLLALHHFSKTLFRAKSQSELFDTTREAIIEILGFDRADIWMIRDNVLVQVSSDMRLPSDFEIPLDASSIVVKVVREKKTVYVPDVSIEPDYLFAEQVLGDEAVSSFEKSRSELAAPVFVFDEVVGVLNVESAIQTSFSDEDILLLEILALHLGNALEKSPDEQKYDN